MDISHWLERRLGSQAQAAEVKMTHTVVSSSLKLCQQPDWHPLRST